MEKYKYAYLYLDGASLWLAIALFCIMILGFIFMGACYLAAERKADRLQVKYNRAKADRQAAEWELRSIKLKGLRMSQETPYKVEPSKGRKTENV